MLNNEEIDSTCVCQKVKDGIMYIYVHNGTNMKQKKQSLFEEGKSDDYMSLK